MPRNENTNKVKYGLKNVYFAKATIAEDGTATYDTPKRWPGAVNLSLDQEGDINKFRADNINYFMAQGNDGYSGTLETALVPEDFKTDILGEILDDDDGVLYEDAEAKISPFALLFQFEGDSKNTRHVFYNCIPSRPSVGSATTEATIEPQTETVDINCGSIYNEEMEKNITKASVKVGDAPYDSWFNAVYQKSGT